MPGIDLSELLLAAASSRPRSDDAKERRTPDDVLALTLKEIQQRIQSGCPFKVGDLVTPREGYGTKGVGRPYVVIEVFSEPVRALNPKDLFSPAYGVVHDIRILGEQCHLHAYMAASYEYEKYAGPVAELHPGA